MRTTETEGRGRYREEKQRLENAAQYRKHSKKSQEGCGGSRARVIPSDSSLHLVIHRSSPVQVLFKCNVSSSGRISVYDFC